MILDVVFFKTNYSNISALISIVEYAFVLFVFINNKEIGIQYFISFTLLSLGWENRTDPNNFISYLNFWGLRFGSFSVNIIVSFIISSYLLFKDKGSIKFEKNIYTTFFLLFISYALIVGTFQYAANKNYQDNYIEDILTYTPFLFYILMFNEISIDSAEKIFKNVLLISVFELIVAFIFNKRFDYAGSHFLVNNAISPILPIAILLSKKLFSNRSWILCSLVVLFFIITQNIFISGKLIIAIILVLLWFCKKNRKLFLFLIIPTLIFIFNISNILIFLTQYFQGNIIAYKFSQINQLIQTTDINNFAAEYSSMGNLLAEFMTISSYFLHNPFYFFTGKGFGGAIPDVLGYLAVAAGNAGYALIDFSRNNYFKMHLPIFEIFIKGGFFFLAFYIYILVKIFRGKENFQFLFFLCFALFFYINKEELLLSLLLLRVSRQIGGFTHLKNDSQILKHCNGHLENN